MSRVRIFLLIQDVPASLLLLLTRRICAVSDSLQLQDLMSVWAVEFLKLLLQVVLVFEAGLATVPHVVAMYGV